MHIRRTLVTVVERGQVKNPETGQWAWERTCGSAADWPTQWDGPVEHWPHIPSRWVPPPDRPPRFATVCIRPSDRTNVEASLEIVRWKSLDEALAAARDLLDVHCGVRCKGRHVVVWTDEAGVHVRRASRPPPPPGRAEAFVKAYPNRNIHDDFVSTPARWPRPSILNEPLDERGTAMTPETRRRIEQDRAIEQTGHRAMRPHPGGLTGRLADAHDDGDEQLATALTDAALSERESGLG